MASVTTAEVGSCQSKWQIKEEQIKALQEKAAESPLATMAIKGC
jgi:hypothetical protein